MTVDPCYNYGFGVIEVDFHCGCVVVAVVLRYLDYDVSLPWGMGVEDPIPSCNPRGAIVTLLIKTHCRCRGCNPGGHGLGGSPHGGAHGHHSATCGRCGSSADDSFYYPIYVCVGCCFLGRHGPAVGGDGYSPDDCSS